MLGNIGAYFYNKFSYHDNENDIGVEQKISGHRFYGLSFLMHKSISNIFYLGLSLSYNIHKLTLDSFIGKVPTDYKQAQAGLVLTIPLN